MNLMYELISSEIELSELKLKRLAISEKHLLQSKPFWFQIKKLKKWENDINNLKQEKDKIIKELHQIYIELENYYID